MCKRFMNDGHMLNVLMALVYRECKEAKFNRFIHNDQTAVINYSDKEFHLWDNIGEIGITTHLGAPTLIPVLKDSQSLNALTIAKRIAMLMENKPIDYDFSYSDAENDKFLEEYERKEEGHIYMSDCSSYGEKKPKQLSGCVKENNYPNSCFYGVEFMTRDYDGYVYYKDKLLPYRPNNSVETIEVKQRIEILQDKCVFLEQKGLNPCREISWDMTDEYISDVGDRLKSLGREKSLMFSVVTYTADDEETSTYFIPGNINEDNVWDNKYVDEFIKCNDGVGKLNAEIELFKFGNGEEQEASDEEARLINCILDKSYGTDEDMVCEAQLGKRISINEHE